MKIISSTGATYTVELTRDEVKKIHDILTTVTVLTSEPGTFALLQGQIGYMIGR